VNVTDCNGGHINWRDVDTAAAGRSRRQASCGEPEYFFTLIVQGLT